MSCALVLLSGGLDSAAALGWAQDRFQKIKAISYQYHLRPFRERLAVLRLLQHFPADLIEVPLPFLKEAADFDSKLSNRAPEGYISNRNMIFYSMAIYFAEMHDCSAIVGGHTAEDQEAFPDAGARFVQALQDLANQALHIRKVKIELPLAGYTKLQVLQKAIEWSIPLEYTWSCYWNQTDPCGVCISCTERAEAFRVLGIKDPLCTT